MNSECLSYSCDNTFKETYVQHIKTALLVWEKIKPYYQRTIRRVFGNTSFDAVALAIALHDLGKLTTAYNVSKRAFRHELFSAYAAYAILKEVNDGKDGYIAYLVATSVMLHHEPGIMKIYIGEYGEKYLTISNLKRIIFNYDLSPSCNIKIILDTLTNDLLLKNGYMDMEIKEALEHFRDKWINGINKNDVYEALKEIIAWVTVMGDPDELLIRRAKIASLLHPLVVSDSIAANIVRRNKCGDYNKKDEGTYITRRALAGAELLNNQVIGEIEKAIENGDNL